ncbi:MAG: LysR family transcriptional regulator [Gammaproteobacteria bacterium]|nr:LysR family transcriptional regulator [Gammaproteobacteria bacterium]
MHITLRQLKTFRAVASLGQVQLAAAQLNLSQPAASMAVSELEKQLNGQLFDRFGNRLKLNARGMRLLPFACELLDRSQEISSLFLQEDDNPSGRLTIGASTTIGNYLLPGILAAYEKKHLDVTASLDIHNSSRVIEKLATFEVDIACIEGPCHHDDIQVLPWLEDELIICAAPSHRLANKSGVTLGELETEYWLLREQGSGTRMLFDYYIAQHMGHLKVRMELNQAEAIKQLVMSGTGISCLSRLSIAHELARGELTAIHLKGCTLTRKLSVLMHKKKYKGALVNSLLNALEMYASV